jgi:CMP-N,N'-diacetyllegionaminic acid synthase
MEILAIIPARGGSKSVPRKNILPINGKPLIAYAIETAKQCEKINRAIVVTDDEEIAAISRQYGADLPFREPDELATDHIHDLLVFQYTLKWLKENENYAPDFIVHLWPTAPIRNPQHIDEAVVMLENDNEAHSVRSVTNPSTSPFRMWRRDKDKYLSYILDKEFPEFYKDRVDPQQGPRQLLPETVVQTEYLAVLRREVIQNGSYAGKNILPFYHDPEIYAEINAHRDVAEVERIMRLNNKIVKNGL